MPYSPVRKKPTLAYAAIGHNRAKMIPTTVDLCIAMITPPIAILEIRSCLFGRQSQGFPML
jgi:hypothetical protein